MSYFQSENVIFDRKATIPLENTAGEAGDVGFTLEQVREVIARLDYSFVVPQENETQSIYVSFGQGNWDCVSQQDEL